MLHQLLRSAVLGVFLSGTIVSLDVSADTATRAGTVNKASITPDQYLGHSSSRIPHKKSTAPPPPQTQEDTSLLAFVRRWNSAAIDASGVDHTPVEPDEQRVFGEAIGPGRSSRAMAIVHIAMFDALAAIKGGYKPYTNIPRVDKPTLVSARAAVSQAAHDTLVAMFPSQKETFDRELRASMHALPANYARMAGSRVGADAAQRILQAHEHDGAEYPEPTMGKDFTPSDQPGWWRADPISGSEVALGAKWGKVKPFVLSSGSQFRVPPPPAMSSKEYAEAYQEVMRLGGDGVTTPTERSEEQTFIGIYWAYDGMPSLCAPPRLYNQIATTIAKQMGSDAMQTARLLALMNIALADAGIAIWESKFHYQVWRPVTAIRESDVGTGPTGAGDGNPATVGDPNFVPLGAPASNLTVPNFTPPFPAYPSGHAGFGGALFQTLRRFYGTDEIAFTFVSDEYNGITLDNLGAIRQLHPRSFKSLSQAEEENGQSRIYLGIHWAFDKSEGITQGQQIADYVFDRIYRPVGE
jgi:hypothetical protein